MAYDGGRAKYETLRTLAFGGISGTYAAIGTAFANPARIIKIKNLTNANILISFDGINNHDILAATSGEVTDYAANKESTTYKLEQPAGTIVYAKQESGAPSSGSINVTVIYASSN